MTEQGLAAAIQAELAVRNLIARLAQAIDDGDLDENRALYTEDATSELPGSAPLRGRADIVADVRQQRDDGLTGPGSGTRHVISTLVVTVDGPATAVADSYWLFFRGTVLAGIGRYHDTVRHDDGAWRIARRQIMLG